jgi:hypothetical protein
MSIALIGLLATDFNYINVYYFSQHLPGGYWCLILGPLIEGILGGAPIFNTRAGEMAC